MKEDAILAAESLDTPFEERLAALELICELEYRNDNKDEEIERWDYTYVTSCSIAANVLSEIKTLPANEYWDIVNSLDKSVAYTLFSAAHSQFDQDTVLAIRESAELSNQSSEVKYFILEALTYHPEYMIDLSETFFEKEYFNNINNNKVFDIFNKGIVNLHTMEDRFNFINYVMDDAYPQLEKYFYDYENMFYTEMSLPTARDEEVRYYKLTDVFPLEEGELDLSHLSPSDDNITQLIPEGKVLVIWENKDYEKYPEANARYSIYGEMLLNLPPGRRPTSIEDVDYLCLLTSSYEKYDEYVTKDEIDSPIITGYSVLTDVNVYDWKTGEFLTHCGTYDSNPGSILSIESGATAFFSTPFTNRILGHIWECLGE